MQEVKAMLKPKDCPVTVPAVDPGVIPTHWSLAEPYQSLIRVLSEPYQSR
jgi:hypothetical protein